MTEYMKMPPKRKSKAFIVEYTYNKATMDTPWCQVIGEQTIIATTKADAINIVIIAAHNNSKESFKIINVTETEV